MLITTAINYTNGDPHIGHCYEAILTDFLARYHRAFKTEANPDIFFQTGTDEHGQKIADRAAKQGITPKELCDHYSDKFKDLAQILEISHDHFIRTTDPSHKENVQRLFKFLLKKEDIYLSNYEGWYNVREETFVTELDAKLASYKDPLTGHPLKRISERSYFFRMTKYLPAVLKHIESTPQFIVPEARRQAFLAQLRRSIESEDSEEQMRDLSISRTTFDWGIPVPDNPAHCLYVWMDALLNYYTGPLALFGPEKTNKILTGGMIHVIGKDILWFHAAIWPALLMALDRPLPNTIWTHDFISDADGRKMSKSLGNVVEPSAIIKKYGVDATRFYLLKETSLGTDLRFNEEHLFQAKKTELAAKLGNLVNRVLNMAKRYCDSKVPICWANPIFDANQLVDKIHECLLKFRVSQIIELVREAIHAVNLDIVQTEIWKLPKEGTFEEMEIINLKKEQLVRAYLESLMIIGKLWAPINPTVSHRIFAALGKATEEPAQDTYFDLVYLDKKRFWCDLEPGTKVLGKLILFPLA